MAEKVEVEVLQPFYDKNCFKKLRNEGDTYECSLTRAEALCEAGFVEILQKDEAGAGDSPNGDEDPSFTGDEKNGTDGDDLNTAVGGTD